jgi:hypothetical protein
MSNTAAEVAGLLDWLAANPHRHAITTMFLYSLCQFDQPLLDKMAAMLRATPSLVVLNFGETGDMAHELDWGGFVDAVAASNVGYLYLADSVAKYAVDKPALRRTLRANRDKPAARAIFVEAGQPRGLIGPGSQSTRLWWPPHSSWQWRVSRAADAEACRAVFADDALFAALKRRILEAEDPSPDKMRDAVAGVLAEAGHASADAAGPGV